MVLPIEIYMISGECRISDKAFYAFHMNYYITSLYGREMR